ncbi:MAG TPA: hypothetical protein PKI94_05360 [Candidatus Gastranaerophilaceae bacterium]|nr:hypothetical protein [Candidatus Gastranaerophilaceae bacterium]
MGFNINPPSNKPVIREAANMQNDGGAGNLGYFEQGEGEKKKQESIFAKEESDSFKKEGDINLPDEPFSFAKLVADIIFAVKEWFKKTFKL